MNIEQKLRLIAGALDRLLPHGHSVELAVRRYPHPPDMQIAIHGAGEWPPRCEICGKFIERKEIVWAGMEQT